MSTAGTDLSVPRPAFGRLGARGCPRGSPRVCPRVSVPGLPHSVHSNHKTQMARCAELRWMALFLAVAGGLPAQPKTLIYQAFDRLYNFDFKPAQDILDRQVQLNR